MTKNITKMFFGAGLATTLLLTGCSSSTSNTGNDDTKTVMEDVEEIEILSLSPQEFVDDYVSNLITDDSEIVNASLVEALEIIKNSEAYNPVETTDVFVLFDDMNDSEVKDIRGKVDGALATTDFYDDKGLSYNEATALRYYALALAFELHNAYDNGIEFDFVATAPEEVDSSFNAAIVLEGDIETIEPLINRFFPNSGIPVITNDAGDWRVSGPSIVDNIKETLANTVIE